MVGQNIAINYPLYDTLDTEQSSKVYDTIKLYSAVNKCKELGIGFDSNRLSAIEIDAMYTLHSSISEVRRARANKGRK